MCICRQHMQARNQILWSCVFVGSICRPKNRYYDHVYLSAAHADQKPDTMIMCICQHDIQARNQILWSCPETRYYDHVYLVTACRLETRFYVHMYFVTAHRLETRYHDHVYLSAAHIGQLLCYVFVNVFVGSTHRPGTRYYNHVHLSAELLIVWAMYGNKDPWYLSMDEISFRRSVNIFGEADLCLQKS